MIHIVRTDMPIYIMFTIEHEDGTIEDVRRELDLTHDEKRDFVERGYFDYT